MLPTWDFQFPICVYLSIPTSTTSLAPTNHFKTDPLSPAHLHGSFTLLYPAPPNTTTKPLIHNPPPNPSNTTSKNLTPPTYPPLNPSTNTISESPHHTRLEPTMTTSEVTPPPSPSSSQPSKHHLNNQSMSSQLKQNGRY